jgi:4-cresol dehydrogenase (hydroxylating)
MMMPEDTLNDFIDAVKAELSAEIIDQSVATLAAWCQATFSHRMTLAFVLSPTNRNQLHIIVSLADHYQIPLHPISGGKNWGYGSRLPNTSGAVIVDLKAINRIVCFDKDAGVVTLEPGVSYQQLQQFLLENHCQWRLNGPGSSPLASVMGNTLERGLNQGSCMEHWRSVISAEIVLPQGEVFRTNTHKRIDKYSLAEHDQTYGQVAGPDLLGLFFQQPLGMVSEITLALDHLPEYWQHLHFSWEEKAVSFRDVSDRLCQLRRCRFLDNSISLHNAEKILSLMMPYPYADALGKTPLPSGTKATAIQSIGGGIGSVKARFRHPPHKGLIVYVMRFRGY